MASVLGSELHHPTMSILWGHGGRSKGNKEEKYTFCPKSENGSFGMLHLWGFLQGKIIYQSYPRLHKKQNSRIRYITQQSIEASQPEFQIRMRVNNGALIWNKSINWFQSFLRNFIQNPITNRILNSVTCDAVQRCWIEQIFLILSVRNSSEL